MEELTSRNSRSAQQVANHCSQLRTYVNLHSKTELCATHKAAKAAAEKKKKDDKDKDKNKGVRLKAGESMMLGGRNLLH
jgi:uncharacterized cupredoxin-like copper-binding protein